MKIEETEAFLRQFAEETADWARERWALGQGFQVAVKCDYSPRRSASRGGVYKGGAGSSISMGRLGEHINERYFKEYDSFFGAIGSLACPCWQDAVRVDVCHEVAHAVQWHHIITTKTRTRGSHSGHGPFFCEIYWEMREALVNGRVGELQPVRDVGAELLAFLD